MPNTHRRRDETVESRRVGGVNTPVGSRDPVYNFLCWQLTSDDIMTSLLKKIVKIHEYYTTQQIRMFTNICSVICYVISYCYAIGCRIIVNWVTADAALCVRIAESVSSRREFMYTPPTRRDKTVSSRRRRRCVLGFIQQESPTVADKPARRLKSGSLFTQGQRKWQFDRSYTTSY